MTDYIDALERFRKMLIHLNEIADKYTRAEDRHGIKVTQDDESKLYKSFCGSHNVYIRCLENNEYWRDNAVVYLSEIVTCLRDLFTGIRSRQEIKLTGQTAEIEFERTVSIFGRIDWKIISVDDNTNKSTFAKLLEVIYESYSKHRDGEMLVKANEARTSLITDLMSTLVEVQEKYDRT